MLRTTITWTNDYVHFRRIFLDIINGRGGLRADYQLQLHGDEVPSEGRVLFSYPNWSESVLALALRAMCQVRWGIQSIPQSRLPSSGICLMDVSVGISKHGVEKLNELEAVRIYADGDNPTCQYRDVLTSAPPRYLTLGPGDSDPFYLAAHAICKALWDTSKLQSLPKPIHLRVHQYEEISYVRLSELLPTSRAAFAVHLLGAMTPCIPGEHSNDCAYLQDWEDFLGTNIPLSKRLKNYCSLTPPWLLPAAAKDADTISPYSQVPGEFSRLLNSDASSGAKTKMRRVSYNGEYFARGCSPPEVFERWTLLEDLAYKYALKANKMIVGKGDRIWEEEILEDFLERLSNGRRGSHEEMKWVIRRAAEILGWTVPAIAMAGI